MTTNDWRLTNQKEYLDNKKLFWKKYSAYSDEWEHDHCEFCGIKFSDKTLEDTLQEGYSTGDNYYWVCEECYKDFKSIFNWRV